MRFNKYNSFIAGYLLLMIFYWIGIQISGIKDLPINLMYSFAINFPPFFGGIFGFAVAKHWGGLKSAVGKGIFYLALGTLSWSIGSFIWSYYNFFASQEVPYPSFADVGYGLAVPLWFIGIYFLSFATGARLSLRKIGGRLYLMLLPIAIAIFSYYFLFIVARNSSLDWQGGLLKIFFDIYYPVSDWVILTFSVLLWGLSLQYLGGKYKWPVLITLLGFMIMYFADFSFSYTTTVETYYNGSFPDLLFAVAMSVISIGITSMDAKT